MSLRGGGYCGFNDSKYDRWLSRLENKIDRIVTALAVLTAEGTKIMSALDDLKAALSGLAGAVSDGVAEIEVLLGKIVAPGTSDADVEAAVAQIQEITKTIADEVAKAQAASP